MKSHNMTDTSEAQPFLRDKVARLEMNADSMVGKPDAEVAE